MTGIVKTDQIQGAQGTTITIPTGNKISIADSATVGTLNATIMKGVTTFADSAVFSGAVSGITTGKVLQVVQGTSTAEFSTSSTSFVKATNLTASITPSATSSKILIQIMGTVETEQYTRHLYMDICRSIGGGSDNLNLSGQTEGLLNYYMGGTTIIRINGIISFLDSPNTTSQCVYNPSIRFGGGNTPGAEFGKPNQLQTIILTEIAG